MNFEETINLYHASSKNLIEILYIPDIKRAGQNGIYLNFYLTGKRDKGLLITFYE
jgi:hypothetical protein